MTLGAIRDWLETFHLAEHLYTNRLVKDEEKSIGVYDRAAYGRPVMAIGGVRNSSYDMLPVSILLHWNRSFTETEEAAQTLWEALAEARHVDMPGGQHIQFLQMTVPKPVYVATDASGIHEYVINFNLYYRR